MSFHLESERLPLRDPAKFSPPRARKCRRSYEEGAGHDAFVWRKFRQAYHARLALPGEYDGVRLQRGADATGHGRALVIVSVDHGKLDRLFLPLAPDDADFCGIAQEAGAARLWQLAREARDEFPEAVLRDVLATGGDA